MKNNAIGILILILYFFGFHICDYFYPNGGVEFIKLRVSIYCIIILLAIEYKKQDLLIEKVFCAVVLNNIILLLFYNETGYTINDIFYIITFTIAQYLKKIYNLYKK